MRSPSIWKADAMDRPVNDVLISRGMRFPLNSDVLRGKSVAALREGRYELREAEAALRIVRSGDVVLELGGGIGFMSTLLATHRKIEHVHVFEANPDLTPYIAAVHAANHVTNATVHNALLGDEPGQVPFYIRRNFLASSMVEDVKGNEVVRTAQVEMRPAEPIARALGATLLICDIEGAEVDVLPKMDLSGLRAAIVELHPQWIGASGVNAVFEAMIKAGLAYFPKTSTQKVVTFRRAWPTK